MTVKRAKGGIRRVNVENVYWVQWTPKKSGKLTAFAVDPDSVERTGKLRALNGSLVPDGAEPAAKDTPKDHFSVTLVAQLHEGKFSRKSKQRPTEKEVKEPKKVEVPAEPFSGIRRQDGKPLGHPSDYMGEVYDIVILDRVVASVPKDKVDPDQEVVFRTTDKSWGLYQNKVRKAFGRLSA